jgi:broad specificity phosphatase PhoE
MSVDLVFETHSWSVDNERGIATGWLPGELSPRGVTEAHRLGARRLSTPIDAVFSSDLRRAAQTAEIAFVNRTVRINLDWRLRECNYGQLNGQSVQALEAHRREHIDVPFPGGESYRQVVDRVRSFLDELRDRNDRNCVLVIGHTATRWALDHMLGGIPLEELVTTPFDWQPGWTYVLN